MGNFDTLETLGPKIKISWNFTLKYFGDVLEEVILLYAKNIPSVQVLRAGSPKKVGSYKLFGNLRRVVRF
jgi:hypothetical protein